MEGSGGVASLTNPILEPFYNFSLSVVCDHSLFSVPFSFSFFFVIAVNSLFLVTCLSLSALCLFFVLFLV